MARLCIRLCLSFCLLSVLSFSLALSSSALSKRLRASQSKLGVLSATEKFDIGGIHISTPHISTPHITNPIPKIIPTIPKIIPTIPKIIPIVISHIPVSVPVITDSCIEHPLKCVSTAGNTLVSIGSSEYNNLISDIQSDWSNIKNGFSDIEAKLKTDYENFVKFVEENLQAEIIGKLVDIIRDVLKKISKSILGKFINLQTQAEMELKEQQDPILKELKSVLAGAKNKMLGIFSSKTTSQDLESQATSPDAEDQSNSVKRTAMEAAEKDVEKELEFVAEDTVSSSSIKRIIGNSMDMGVVFAVIDIGLLSLGYPITVFEAREDLHNGNSTSFQVDFVNYYQYALLNTLKNVAGDFLSILVDAISAELTVDILAAIDVATLGLGILATAALSFIIDFVISFVLNMILTVIISLSFPPFYNLFWHANLENDVTDLAALLAPSAVELCEAF